jgi:hypothetical protein
MNKLTGTVKIKKETNNKLPKVQIKIELCNTITNKDTTINEQSVNTNKIAKKKKSSTGPTSFSLSFNINNLTKLFKYNNCLM